ncbi:hypothetical protein AF72_02430 [Xylella taiwanensis]|uniref:Uncharacterized protein n=1 Tax=Xylella taiwanensis TaxID=1444770 RepID=Z9JLR1_9GAMM|nr:hypothetical protein AB672_09005 [Xylella taiwanensis]EWS79084.1 hypothetical protein AF72_02430 [Xylella taiwanensis]
MSANKSDVRLCMRLARISAVVIQVFAPCLFLTGMSLGTLRAGLLSQSIPDDRCPLATLVLAIVAFRK